MTASFPRKAHGILIFPLYLLYEVSIRVVGWAEPNE